MGLFRLFSQKKTPTPFSKSMFLLLGVYPKNEALYKNALVHRSVNPSKKSGKNSERLEFLGDSVIELVVTEWLMDLYKNEQEGVLTQLRSTIVSRKNLNHCAIKIGIDRHIQVSGKINLHNTSLPGNCVESIIGAVYIDQGIDVSRQVIWNVILSHVDPKKLITTKTNYKSFILQWSQKERKNLRFEINREKDTGKEFLANVILEEIIIATATGKNKKEASQRASKKAIETLKIETSV